MPSSSSVARRTLIPHPARRATTVPVILKVYPLMSWLWGGLAAMLAGVAWRLAAERYEARRPR